MTKSKSKAAYMISAVAEQYAIHPQTPRLYTEDDLERLEVILHLTRDLGVNLAGVEIILNMREKMGEMQSQIQEFVATLNRELVARSARPSTDDRTGLIPVINARPPGPTRRRQ